MTALARQLEERNSEMFSRSRWDSNETLEDEWMKCVKLTRQVGTTSLGDDARETPTVAGLGTAKERNLEQHCGCVWCCVQARMSICARQWTQARHSPRQWTATQWCARVLAAAGVAMSSQRGGCATRSVAPVARLVI